MAKEKSSPIYSIGKQARFSANDNSQFSSIPQYTPGPQYDVTDVTKYKFKTSSKWRIGSAKRYADQMKDNNKNNCNYRKVEDYPSKWRTRIIGGPFGVEARVKYDLSEKTPGPGRYEDSFKKVRPRTPAYCIAERTGFSSIKQLVGTSKKVGPGAYRVESARFTSKHRNFPAYSIGKQGMNKSSKEDRPRKEPFSTWDYSSLGNQSYSKKRTEPRAKIGKSTRERETFRGTFKSMMDRQPVKVSIPMPKIF